MLFSRSLFPAPAYPARNCILTNTLVFVNTRFAQPGPIAARFMPCARLRFVRRGFVCYHTRYSFVNGVRLVFPGRISSSFSDTSRRLFRLLSSLSSFFFRKPVFTALRYSTKSSSLLSTWIQQKILRFDKTIFRLPLYSL